MTHKLKLVRPGYYRFGNYQVLKHEDRWYVSRCVPGFPIDRICEGTTRDVAFKRLQRALFGFYFH